VDGRVKLGHDVGDMHQLDFVFTATMVIGTST
jgi:hypothetical protein